MMMRASAAQGARDLDELLLGHRKIRRRTVGIDLRAGPCEQGDGGTAAVRPVDPPPIRGALEAEGQVLRHREMGKKRRLLVDDCNAPIPRGERSVLTDRHAVDRQRAGIGLDGAREDA